MHAATRGSPFGALLHACTAMLWPCLALATIATCMAADGSSHPWGRSQSLPASPAASPGFLRLAPSETGLAFTNRLSLERQTTNQIYLNGSGVALGDIDGDGRCDVFLAGLDGGSTLFRNLGEIGRAHV